MRWIAFIFVLLFSFTAHAFPRGGTALVSCGNPSSVGTIISIANISCTLLNANGTWQFSSTQVGSFPDNNTFALPVGIGAFGVKAELCSGSYPYNPYVGWEMDGIDSQTIYMAHVASGTNNQGTGLCSPIGTSYFFNNTTTTGYYNTVALFSGAATSNAIEVKAPPVGVPFYYDGGSITATGVTATLDSGVIYDYGAAPTPAGHGTLLVDGVNDTLNGGTVIHGTVRADSPSCAPSCTSGQYTNPTIENVTVKTNNTAISSCIETGYFNGEVTLLNDTVHNCGFSPSYHNIYISAQAVTTGLDPTCENVNGVLSYDVMGDDWPLKVRTGCGVNSYTTACGTTVAGCITNTYLVCQDAVNCGQNAILDYPCGGDHILSYSTLEAGPAYNGGGAAWRMIRYGEEVPISGTANCPQAINANAYPTYNLAIDHVIVINDASTNSTYWSDVVCMGSPGASDCGSGTIGTGWGWTLTNSVIVGNPNGTGGGWNGQMQPGYGVGTGAGCTLSGGKCTDANNNRWYSDRLTAAQNEGWINTTDQFGNTCTVANSCAFPYIPNHM
ncbi:MAG: hypothetical protein KGJ90_00435 [Patescibacteria group bacterium]|nr:hypothetical protein [Patescibacteria group bacterium]